MTHDTSFNKLQWMFIQLGANEIGVQQRKTKASDSRALATQSIVKLFLAICRHLAKNS